MKPEKPSVLDHWFESIKTRHPAGTTGGIPLILVQDVVNPSHRLLADLENRHHDFLMLSLVRQGRGLHVIDGISYTISRGDVYLLGTRALHSYSQCEDLIVEGLFFQSNIFDPQTWEWLRQTPGFLPLFLEEPLNRVATGQRGGRWLHLTPDAYWSATLLLEELRQEWQAGTPDGMALTRGLFLRLLVFLARRYANTPKSTVPELRTLVPGLRTLPRSQETTAAAALQYMEAHFTEPLRIEEVAASVFLSKARFVEVFSDAMGRTPADYLRFLRLERAKLLLLTTTDSVTDIALHSGFSDAAYFARAFRAAVGLTPSRFRQG